MRPGARVEKADASHGTSLTRAGPAHSRDSPQYVAAFYGRPIRVGPDGRARRGGDAVAMTRSPRTHTVGDTRFFLLLTAAHAAVAFPALRLWAAACERSRRRR